MSTTLDCARACVMALTIVASVAVGTLGIAAWQADASQSEARAWVRTDGGGCRYVRVSEAVDALPCQS